MLKTNEYCRDFLLGANYSIKQSADMQNSIYHCHCHYEIYYLADGSRDYLIGNQRYAVQSGDFVLVSPGLLHQTFGQAQSRSVILFNQDLLHPYYHGEQQDALLSVFRTPTLRLPAAQLPTAELLLSQMKAAADAGDETFFAHTLVYLLTVLSHYRQEVPQSTDTPSLIDGITAYINENAYTIEHLDEIADAFHISKYYLCHLFMKEKQMTVGDYLLSIRIARAAYLLIHTDDKISDIAYTCGFRSEFYFSRRFRLVTDMTPSAYRKMYRG